MNMRAVGLDRRREVGIFVDDAKVVIQIEHVFALDWEQKSGSVQTIKTQAPRRHDAVGRNAGGSGLRLRAAFENGRAQPVPALSWRELDRPEHDERRRHRAPERSRSHARIAIDNGATTLRDLRARTERSSTARPSRVRCR